MILMRDGAFALSASFGIGPRLVMLKAFGMG
jgi:hypothetical protein